MSQERIDWWWPRIAGGILAIGLLLRFFAQNQDYAPYIYKPGKIALMFGGVALLVFLVKKLIRRLGVTY